MATTAATAIKYIGNIAPGIRLAIVEETFANNFGGAQTLDMSSYGFSTIYAVSGASGMCAGYDAVGTWSTTTVSMAPYYCNDDAGADGPGIIVPNGAWEDNQTAQYAVIGV